MTKDERDFAVRAPRLWNTLPIKIRQATSLASFKSSLKTFLCEGIYEFLNISYFCSTLAI
ncbi:hypothetical protein LDENG_00256840 [Lucifuga dentata]|nr:hypothetical protein LDENG_00256840 [Lucifuga dentata]